MSARTKGPEQVGGSEGVVRMIPKFMPHVENPGEKGEFWLRGGTGNIALGKFGADPYNKRSRSRAASQREPISG